MKAVAILPFVTMAMAQSTSLFLPMLDPQPLSIDVLGVDGQGHTTYQLAPGEGASDGLVGTATVVAGSDFMSFTQVMPPGKVDSVGFTLGMVCSYQGSNAVCVEAGMGQTATETVPVSGLAVQLGSTVAGGAQATATSSSSNGNPGTPPKASAGSGSGTGSSSPNQTQAPSASSRATANSVLGGLIMVVGWLLVSA